MVLAERRPSLFAFVRWRDLLRHTCYYKGRERCLSMPKENYDKPIGAIDELAVAVYEEPYHVGGKPRSKRGWQEDKAKATYDIPEALTERFAAWLSDEDYLSLAKEIALLRTFLDTMLATLKLWQEKAQEALENGEEPPAKPPVSYSQILAAIDNVGKMVERQNRIVYADNNLVTVESAIAFATALAEMNARYVKDPKTLEAIFTGIRGLLTAGRGFKMDMKVVRRILDPIPTPLDEEKEPSDAAD